MSVASESGSPTAAWISREERAERLEEVQGEQQNPSGRAASPRRREESIVTRKGMKQCRTEEKRV